MLPKIEHDMLKEAGRQELVTVQQLCGAVLEKNPDVEQDFILGLRQPTKSWQEKGEQILNQYGYDEEHLLADNTLYAAYMIAWRNWTGFFLITTFLLLATSLLYFYSIIRNSNREILLILEQYLSEDFSFAYGTERIAKGRIHFMSNQIGDRLATGTSDCNEKYPDYRGTRKHKSTCDRYFSSAKNTNGSIENLLLYIFGCF